MSIETVTVEHEVHLWKETKRELTAIDAQLDQLMASINTGGRQRRGWTIQLLTTDTGKRFLQSGSAGNWRYDLTLEVKCETDRDTVDDEYRAILKAILKKATAVQYGAWSVDNVDGVAADSEDVTEVAESDIVSYAPCMLPADWTGFFGHLYGLDDHIERVRRAVDAAIMSDWQHRCHCALIGPPGCGKSDICQSVKSALGEESVLEFDATSTTMAGAQKTLGDRDELPRVILIEEIEKANDNALQWLLAVLDLRGSVKRITARAKVMTDAKMLAIATVNDHELFGRMMSGALASRFSNEVWFERPNRETLEKILLREIEKVDGNPEWCEATLDYTEGKQITDPRRVISICMCGRDALVSGEYQRMLDATSQKFPYYKSEGKR